MWYAVVGLDRVTAVLSGGPMVTLAHKRDCPNTPPRRNEFVMNP